MELSEKDRLFHPLNIQQLDDNNASSTNSEVISAGASANHGVINSLLLQNTNSSSPAANSMGSSSSVSSSSSSLSHGNSSVLQAGKMAAATTATSIIGDELIKHDTHKSHHDKDENQSLHSPTKKQHDQCEQQQHSSKSSNICDNKTMLPPLSPHSAISANSYARYHLEESVYIPESFKRKKEILASPSPSFSSSLALQKRRKTPKKASSQSSCSSGSRSQHHQGSSSSSVRKSKRIKTIDDTTQHSDKAAMVLSKTLKPTSAVGRQNKRSTKSKYNDTHKKHRHSSSSTASTTTTVSSCSAAERQQQTNYRPPVFQWMDKGTLNLQNGKTYHKTLKIRVGGRLGIIHAGDSVLLCSGEDDKEYFVPPPPPRQRQHQPSSSEKEEVFSVSGSNISSLQDEDDNDNDVQDHLFQGINSLDPFVARVESMWEDPPPSGPAAVTASSSTRRRRPNKGAKNQKIRRKSNQNNPRRNTRSKSLQDNIGTKDVNTTSKLPEDTNQDHNDDDSDNDSHDEDRAMRMKIRARWYFKKEDIELFNDSTAFRGITKKALLSLMGPRDVVLSNLTDDNEAPTILGKCMVSRLTPPPSSISFPSEEETAKARKQTKKQKQLRHSLSSVSLQDQIRRYESVPSGAYVCCYDINIPQKGKKGNKLVCVTPYIPSAPSMKQEKCAMDSIIVQQDQRYEDSIKNVKENHESNFRSRIDSSTPVNNIAMTSSSRSEVVLESAISRKDNDNKNSSKEMYGSVMDGFPGDGNYHNKNTQLLIPTDKGGTNGSSDNVDEHDDMTCNNSSVDSDEKYSDEEEKTRQYLGDGENKSHTSELRMSDGETGTQEDNEENEGEVEDEQNKHKPSIFQNNSDLEKKKKKSSIIAKPQQQQPLACLQNEGTIRVGNQHQASVPPLQTVPTIGMTHGTTSNAFPTECTSSAQHQHRNNKFAFLAKPCWAPGRISHTIVIKYLYDTGKFLNEYLKQCKEQDVTYASLSDQDDELWYRPQRQQNPPTITRECDRDRLLDELHNCDYSVTSAMQKVHLNPTYYLTLWSYAEKNQFDAGSRRYCGSLRMVTKGVPTKVEKEIVDYHYRFKITDQFRRYEEQKREQAQRMMVEADARLRENFSVRKGGEADSGLILGGSIAGATGGNGFSSGSGGGNTQKKLRNITSLGATEQRRHVAQDYLIHVRDVIGSKHYLRLVAVLKRYHEGDLDVPLLIEHITNLLQNSPNNPKEAEALVPKFLTFVPQIFRSDK